MAITLTDIKSEFGSYYLAGGQGEKDLVQQLYQKGVTESVFSTRVLAAGQTRYEGAESTITRLLQPFQKSFTPIGTVGFKPIVIEMAHMKVDFKEYLSDLEASWLGFLADSNKKVTEYPFVRWLMEKHILPKQEEDYELNEIYTGVKAAPTSGTAGNAGTSIDGIKKVINDYVDGGRIDTISTGALETNPVDFVAQIEDFVDAINAKYRNKQMPLCMSPTLARRYDRGYQEKYGKNMNYTENTGRKIEFTPQTIIGLPSMEGSDKIWMTPSENAVRIINGSVPTWEIGQFSERQVSIFADWYKGFGFLIPEVVFTNDLELS